MGETIMNISKIAAILNGAFGFVTFKKDANNNPIGLATGSGGRFNFGYTHVCLGVTGDSISERATYGMGLPLIGSPSITPLTCCNEVIGSPFYFSHNVAVGGDTLLGAGSRISSIPSHVQVISDNSGINDINNSTASAATMFAKIVATATSVINSGRIFIRPTLMACDHSTAPQGVRLLALNALILTLPSMFPGKVFVPDWFAATWNGVTSGTGVAAITGYLDPADGVHPMVPCSIACAVHPTSIAAFKSAYSMCIPDINIYQGFQVNRSLYTDFRRSTGGQVGTNNGVMTGTIGDDYQAVLLHGSPTCALDATQAYTSNPNFIGPWNNAAQSIDSYWQYMTFGTTAAADIASLYNMTAINNTPASLRDGLYAGAEVFMECEVDVQSPANLSDVYFQASVALNVGTPTYDIPAYGNANGGYVGTSAGTREGTANVSTVSMGACRRVLRTPVIRVPENIQSPVVTLTKTLNARFIGNGSGTIVRWG